MNIKGVLTALAPRVIGAGVAAAAGWIYTQSKHTVQLDIPAITTMLVAYAAGHRGASAVINPGDAATGRIAEAEKSVAEMGGTPFVRRPE